VFKCLHERPESRRTNGGLAIRDCSSGWPAAFQNKAMDETRRARYEADHRPERRKEGASAIPGFGKEVKDDLYFELQ